MPLAGEALTDTEGVARFPHMAKRPAEFSVRAPGFKDHSAAIEWTGRETLEWTLERVQLTEVKVVSESGDPVGGVKRMYQHFGLELSAEAERRMRGWHANHPQGQHGGHHYTAESFGLSDGEIRERFGPYIERYRVPLESRS